MHYIALNSGHTRFNAKRPNSAW